MSSDIVPLRVLICQSNGALGDSIEENISRWRQKLLTPDSRGSLSGKNDSLDVIHFPETAFQRYFYRDRSDLEAYGGLEESGQGPIFAFLKELALFFNAYVIAGYAEKTDSGDTYHNSFYVLGRDGHLLLNHRKKDLFQPDLSWSVPASSSPKYATFPMANTKGHELLAGLILCQELLGFTTGEEVRSGDILPNPATQFASDGVQVVFFSCCWPTNTPGLREFGAIWEKKMRPMFINCSEPPSEPSKSWLFCVANGCGSEANCLSAESWGSLTTFAEKDVLHKKGSSAAKKYPVIASSNDCVACNSGSFPDVTLQSDATDTEGVLPSEEEGWKVYEAQLLV